MDNKLVISSPSKPAEVEVAPVLPSTGGKLYAGKFPVELSRSEVRRWQRFLQSHDIFTGENDGDFGPKTEAATQELLRRQKITVTDKLDRATLEKARLPNGQKFTMDPAVFRMGPNIEQEGDVRYRRPYFLVPLDEFGQPLPIDDDLVTTTRGNIQRWIDTSTKEAASLLLRKEDLKGSAGLAQRLLARDTEEGKHFRELLSCDTVRLLERALSRFNSGGGQTTPAGNLPDSLHVALVNEINALMQGEYFYTPAAFPDALWQTNVGTQPVVAHELKCLLQLQDGQDALAALRTRVKDPEQAQKLNGRDLLLVNRLLLMLAFGDHIAPFRERGRITDVFVLSHGWHRNFFQAVAAYDQIIGRFSVLMHRRAIKSPEPYHPLFLAVHWHSDPGENGWVDAAGRRNKDSFLQNIEVRFERPSAVSERHVRDGERFTDVWEEVFQLFSRMSALDTDPIQDDRMGEDAPRLGLLLDRFALREAAAADLNEKIAVAWTCYTRARPKGALIDQELKSARSLTTPQAIVNFFRFLLGALGIVAVLGLLLRTPFVGKLSVFTESLLFQANAAVRLPLIERGVAGVLAWFLASLLVWTVVIAVPVLVGRTFLWLCGLTPDDQKRKRGVPLWLLVCWLPVQILYALPWLAWLFGIYFVAPRQKVSLSRLFDERFGDREKEIQPADRDRLLKRNKRFRGSTNLRATTPALALAMRARRPVQWFRRTLHPDNPGHPLVNAVDSQMAFWEMQTHGVRVTHTAAHFLASLFEKEQKLSAARVHFLGHSFGGLVVLNIVRNLIMDKDLKLLWNAHRINSICLLQAAVASNWLEEESTILNNVSSVGCIYSAYDTANSFYYPVANKGRMGAGYVGLYYSERKLFKFPREHKSSSASETHREDRGLLASLVKPPPLREILAADPSIPRSPKGELGPGLLVNLDASRLIYEGSVPLGGGHGDVFKDDVVHLCWAVAELGMPKVLSQEGDSGVSPAASTASSSG